MSKQIDMLNMNTKDYGNNLLKRKRIAAPAKQPKKAYNNITYNNLPVSVNKHQTRKKCQILPDQSPMTPMEPLFSSDNDEDMFSTIPASRQFSKTIQGITDLGAVREGTDIPLAESSSDSDYDESPPPAKKTAAPLVVSEKKKPGRQPRNTAPSTSTSVKRLAPKKSQPASSENKPDTKSARSTRNMKVSYCEDTEQRPMRTFDISVYTEDLLDKGNLVFTKDKPFMIDVKPTMNSVTPVKFGLESVKRKARLLLSGVYISHLSRSVTKIAYYRDQLPRTIEIEHPAKISKNTFKEIYDSFINEPSLADYVGQTSNINSFGWLEKQSMVSIMYKLFGKDVVTSSCTFNLITLMLSKYGTQVMKSTIDIAFERQNYGSEKYKPNDPRQESIDKFFVQYFSAKSEDKQTLNLDCGVMKMLFKTKFQRVHNCHKYAPFIIKNIANHSSVPLRILNDLGADKHIPDRTIVVTPATMPCLLTLSDKKRLYTFAKIACVSSTSFSNLCHFYISPKLPMLVYIEFSCALYLHLLLYYAACTRPELGITKFSDMGKINGKIINSLNITDLYIANSFIYLDSNMFMSFKDYHAAYTLKLSNLVNSDDALKKQLAPMSLASLMRIDIDRDILGKEYDLVNNSLNYEERLEQVENMLLDKIMCHLTTTMPSRQIEGIEDAMFIPSKKTPDHTKSNVTISSDTNGVLMQMNQNIEKMMQTFSALLSCQPNFTHMCNNIQPPIAESCTSNGDIQDRETVSHTMISNSPVGAQLASNNQVPQALPQNNFQNNFQQDYMDISFNDLDLADLENYTNIGDYTTEYQASKNGENKGKDFYNQESSKETENAVNNLMSLF